jgi:hypothetical protein
MNSQSITLVYRNVRFLRIEVENGLVRFVVPKDFNEDINKIKENYKE